MKPSSSGEVAPFLPGRTGSLNCTVAGNMDFPMDFRKLRRQSEARGPEGGSSGSVEHISILIDLVPNGLVYGKIHRKPTGNRGSMDFP